MYCYKIVTYTKDDSQTIVKKLHPRAVDAKFQHVRVHIRRLMRHSYDAARIYIPEVFANMDKSDEPQNICPPRGRSDTASGDQKLSGIPRGGFAKRIWVAGRSDGPEDENTLILTSVNLWQSAAFDRSSYIIYARRDRNANPVVANVDVREIIRSCRNASLGSLVLRTLATLQVRSFTQKFVRRRIFANSSSSLHELSFSITALQSIESPTCDRCSMYLIA